MDHPAVVTFLILAVIAAMSLAAEVLKPLALAVLLSFALAPLAGFFERRRVPRALAVLLTVALTLGSLIGIGFVVERQLAMLAYQLPSYQERIQKKVDFLTPSDVTSRLVGASAARLLLHFAEPWRFGQGEEHDLLASDGADVVVHADDLDAGDFPDHRLHQRSRGFEKMRANLLEQVSAFLGRQ
jgi:AI-2E family transporter